MKTILERKSEALTQLAEIHQRANDKGRAMTPSEQKQWDEANAEFLAMAKAKEEKEQVLRSFSQAARQRDTGKNADNRSTVLADVAHAVMGTGNKRDGITSTNGAAVIETDNVRDELVHELQSANPLRKLGTRFIDMVNHSVFPTVSGIGYSHFAEGDNVTINPGPVIGSRNLEFKTMTILLKVSKLWMRDTSERGRRLLNTVIVDAINNAIINTALHGNTADKEPNGLDNITGVQAIDAAGAAITNYNLHLDAVAALAAQNVDVSRIGYIQGTRSWRQTAGLVDADGQPLMPPKAISGMNAEHTTAVKEDYGAGNDQTRMYFGDFSNLIVGMGGTFRMELAERYADTMQTGFLAYLRYDVQALRPNNFCILENLATS